MNTFSNGQSTYRHGRRDIIIGFMGSFFLLCLFYPGFVFFETSPMHANSWEISDPSVSWANFMPSFRVFQYELYNNANILWSSLRTMGMPILANDIQAAPLFPLTVLFSWLDENIFWNVFVAARLVLLGLGTYLLARRFFGFQKLPSIYFIVTFVYALYVMRWMNNPWQNGLLAGVWYLYFLCRTLEMPSWYTLKRVRVFLGLVLAVFMMVTCGFPEASVMCAILVILVFTPLLVSRVWRKEVKLKPFFQDLLLAHIAGFALSSFQIFSIIELLAASESHRFVGLRQYAAADIIPFFAENLTRFLESGPRLYGDSRTYLGLIPVAFFLAGIASTIKNVRRIGAGEVGALLCGLFIILKMFAIGPGWFNELVASPPILRESYFYVYFFSIFLWFFSFFSARGFQEVVGISGKRGSAISTTWKHLLSVAFLAVIPLVWFAAPLATEQNLWELVVIERQRILFRVLVVFAAALGGIFLCLYLRKSRFISILLPFLLLGLVIFENALVLPSDFHALKDRDNQEIDHILDELKKRDIPIVESRIIDRNGTYVSHGLATIDTGATPLLPKRTQTFRTNFFKTVRAGHLSIDAPKNRFAWGLTSTNLRSLDRYYGGGEGGFPDWSSWEKKEGGTIHLDEMKFNDQDLAQNTMTHISGGFHGYLYFRGWAIGTEQESLDSTAVYIILKGQDEEIVIPVRKAVRHDVARHLQDEKFIMAGWDSYVSASLPAEGSYAVHIRFADHLKRQYYEKITDSRLQFSKKEEVSPNKVIFSLDDDNKEFLGVLDQYYIYLDRTALPRAYIASRCQYYPSLKNVVDEFKSTTTFQLGHVYLEGLSEEEQIFCRNYNAVVSRVPIVEDGGDNLELGKVQGPAILVLNDNVYDGWNAFDTVKKISLAIKPANITFRSLILPEEREYHIIFTYKPKWLPIARVFLAIGLLSLLLPMFLFIRRHTKSEYPIEEYHGFNRN